MTGLVTEHRIAADDVEDVEVLLPPNGASIVNDRSMPDVNCQYCMAAVLLDGGRLTFDATHSYERMSDPEIVAIKSRVRLTPNPEFVGMERQRPATVRIRMKDGTLHERHVPAVRGTWDSPMTHDEVDAKAVDLIGGVYGATRARELADAVWGLDLLASVRSLRPLLQSS